MLAAKLATQFDIPNALRVEDAPGDLVRAVISTPAAEAVIYLQGAHVTHWTPRGQRPVLFVRPLSLFAPGKPIRGGVPVIFPWFGPRSDGQAGANGLDRHATGVRIICCREPDGPQAKVSAGVGITSRASRLIDKGGHVRAL